MLRRLTRGRTEKLALLTSRAMEERHDHLRNPAPGARRRITLPAGRDLRIIVVFEHVELSFARWVLVVFGHVLHRG